MIDSSKPAADYGGARGSNAGDQFHELWALQRALSLLDTSLGLTALEVEGVTTSELSTDDKAVWEGVDCSLYFGGKSIAAADRIELAQLKYSAANPETKWTIARLRENTRKIGNNSVLRRLADAFVAARKEMKADAILSVRLISNQPVSQEVLDIVRASWSGPLADAALDAKRKAHIATVKEATGLEDKELIEFLAVLDVTECGVASRFALRDAIVGIVADSISDDANAQVRELQTRVRELMLPERIREIITFETVLGWFDIASVSGLFPAQSDFKVVNDPILRQPAKALFQKIEAGAKLTCLHGPAGCGKTTTMRQLGELLPASSTFVLFDCYGGGRYIYSDDRRHLPENAFIQIANELSLTLGVPFLLARGSRNPANVRRFLERVQKAALILRKLNSGALLVIGIDAADNSVAAAARPSPADPCFVHELAKADISSLADNVRFVFSTRTGRRHTLELPSSAVEVLCPPFELSETTELVHLCLPAVSEAWIEQFHALSNGVPRVQDYAIKAGAGDAGDTLDALRPRGKGLTDILRQLFETAAAKNGDSSLYKLVVSALAALPAPIPPKLLAAVCDASEADILDFVDDIQPSLRRDVDGISIADEDVEDFIRAEGATGLASAQARVCAHFATIYLTDSYAAIHYGDMLSATGRASEILSIVEADLAPAAIADPIVRREVQLRRLRFALAACRHAGNPVESSKVLLLAAEAAKDEAALTAILEEHTDLATRFARSSLMRLVLSDPDSAGRQGAALAFDAARAARAGNRIEAREQLHYLDIWNARRRLVDEQEMHHWKIDDVDLAARIEAIALLLGPERAIRDLRRWTPNHVPLSIAMKLVPSLISRGNADIVAQALKESLLPRAYQLLLIVPLALSGAAIDMEQLKQALQALRQPLVPRAEGLGYTSGDGNWQTELIDVVIAACEIGVARGIEHAVINHALGLVADFTTPRSPRQNRIEAPVLDALIRGWFLHRIINGGSSSLDEFLKLIDPKPPEPPPLAPNKQKGRKGKARSAPRHDDESQKYIRAVFPVYESRNRALQDSALGRPIDQSYVQSISGYATDEYTFERDYQGYAYRARTSRTVLELMHLDDLPIDQLLKKASALASTRFSDPFATRLLPLWHMVLMRRQTHDLVLHAVFEKSEQARRERSPASDKVDAFINFSRLVLNFSEPDAKTLFEEAVARAQDIDEEAIDQIEFLAALTPHFAAWAESTRKVQAIRMFRFVTDVAERLRNQEHFPWDESIAGIARLSPSVALASIARWSDEGIEGHEQTLPVFIREMTQLRLLAPNSATALLVLMDHSSSNVVREILEALGGADRDIRASILEQLASDCLLNIPPCDPQSVGPRIVETAVAAGLKDLRSVSELEKTLLFIDRNKRPEKDKAAPEDAPSVEVDFSGQRFVMAAAVQAGYEAARATGRYFSTENVLKLMRLATGAPGDRVPFLDALAEADLGQFSDGYKMSAILEAVAAWDSSPSIQQWKRQRLPEVIVQHFVGLAQWLKRGSDHLTLALDATAASPADIRTILLQGVEGTGLALGSRSLFGVAERLAKSMDAGDAWTVLDWYLTRLSARVSTDAIEMVTDDLPNDIDDAIGRFIFALMSDVDTRVRWRAAHVVRRLARLGAQKPFDAVYAHYDRKTDESFRDATAPYYWLAARLWAIMAAARVAVEAPRVVAPMLRKLVEIARDRTLPHVLIRENARRAVLALVKAGETLPTATIAVVTDVNKPKLRRVAKTKNWHRPHLGWADARDRRFDFDGMDVMDHWYGPVLGIFANLDKNDLLNSLEHWIVDKWHAPTNARRWDEEPRKSRYDDRQFPLWSVHHGSLPTVERYATYLQWHAMFCAVGELLPKYAVMEPEYEDDYDSFENWFNSNLPAVPPFWFADFRQPKPLDVSLWYQNEQPERYWLSRCSIDLFLSTLQPEGKATTSFLTVSGEWTASFPTRETTVTISSALVSPPTAVALARSLLKADNYAYGHSFPDEEGHGGINAAPYKLRGWTRGVRHPERFDRHDPLIHALSSTEINPGDGLIAALALQRDPATWGLWRLGMGGTVAAIFRTWSDLPVMYDGDRDYRPRISKSNGASLQVRSDVLSSYLALKKMDLIVGVNFIRRVEKEYGRSYESDPKKRKSFQKIFILRADGEIQDAKGRVGSWR